MEASKCPKCGEEPHFVESVEKWYCYGCNEYLEGEESQEAKVEEPTQVAQEHAGAIAAELRELEREDALVCKKCGAELEHVNDGRMYCYICESYPDEPQTNARDESKHDDAQALLDSIPSPVISQETTTPAVDSGPAPLAVPTKPVEPNIENRPEVKMCSTCGQPLKWIDKYQRHYCYGCRKYAPKEAPSQKPEPTPEKVNMRAKSCPGCKGELKFIEKYNEYYCFACKKYPLRAKREASRVPHQDLCPKCGKPLKHVEKYDRDYCYSCKQYAPKKGASPASERKTCPACSSEMKYVTEYNEWYCYKCKKYSLRPAKPVLLF